MEEQDLEFLEELRKEFGEFYYTSIEDTEFYKEIVKRETEE